MNASIPAGASGIAVFDARPFFAKALAYGVQHRLLDTDKLSAMRAEAPKGMVQIARYFGTEYLRPELEKAKERMVNLISLHLQLASGGNLQHAAELLRDHSLLSRSKAGSDMLKALLGMPQNSHFSMHEGRGFQDEQIPVLERWTLKPDATLVPEYQAELAKRQTVAHTIDAALWLAEQRGMDYDALLEEGPDAEAVIRTCLLMGMTRRTDMPDWVTFEKVIASLRAKFGAKPKDLPKLLAPKGAPDEWAATLQAQRESIWNDWPRIVDSSVPVRKLFQNTPAFTGRYFWLEDGLAEVEELERSISAVWAQATRGFEDEGSLMTVFLTLAAGSKPSTLLTEKQAATLVRKIRKTGLDAPLAADFIRSHAPPDFREDYLAMWDVFVEDALPTLRSDLDYALHDALALLRRECNVGA